MREVFIRIKDDFDHEQLADKTVSFSVDGQFYEIDLTAAHADDFAADIAKYVDVARAVDNPFKPNRRRKPAAAAAVSAQHGSVQNVAALIAAKPLSRKAAMKRRRAELIKIRDWANAHGFTVSYQGVVPAAAVAAYEAAHGG